MNRDGCAELLEILKEYHEQQWQSIKLDWFQNFLIEQKSNDNMNEEYQRVLTRTT